MAFRAPLALRAPRGVGIPLSLSQRLTADSVSPAMILSAIVCRTVAAAEAARLRLAELVVPGAELDGAVSDLVAALLTVEPAVARATKELLS